MTPHDNNGDKITEILVRLERIETKLEDRDRRLSAVERVVGKHTFIAAIVSAVVYSVILAVKYVSGK